ncbi:MAG: hypothetical protein AVW06_00505 [Hadesarchaea archaeon DG-33-1]|nr:MAG: hypothetical protein AVW06_00505 [Hadesarchaea archaeon DG-33-1]
MRKVEIIFVVALIALIVIVVFVGRGREEVKGDAPSFTLTGTDGDDFSLSDFRGKVVVLDLMATWCGPCILEIPHLKEVQQHYGDDVIILSISVGGDSNQELKNFKVVHGATWRFAVDTDDVIIKYSAFQIPKLVIIDESGNIRFAREGTISSSELIEKIDVLL